MSEHHAGIAGTTRINIPQSQWPAFAEKPRTHKGIGKTQFLSNELALQEIFRYTTPMNLIGGVMMLRSLVAETRFRQDLHIGEDFFFMYENLIKGPDVIFVTPKWYYARIHSNNLSWDYSFEGFRSRFDRRKLVWLSEEALGRTGNAKLQQQDALDVYLRCLKQHGTVNQDTEKMRSTMKAHKKELLPGLSAKQKLLFGLSVYLPGLYLHLFGKK